MLTVQTRVEGLNTSSNTKRTNRKNQGQNLNKVLPSSGTQLYLKQMIAFFYGKKTQTQQLLTNCNFKILRNLKKTRNHAQISSSQCHECYIKFQLFFFSHLPRSNLLHQILDILMKLEDHTKATKVTILGPRLVSAYNT